MISKNNIDIDKLLVLSNFYNTQSYPLTLRTYIFTAEQDNWVYAPEGGVSVRQDYYGSDLDSGSHAMSVYLTTKQFEEILNTDLNVVVNIPCNPTYRGAITTLEGWQNYHYINRYEYSERTLVHADTVILSYKDKKFKELSLTDK